MKLNRLLPLLAPLAVYGLAEIYFFHPKLIYAAAAAINLLIFFTVWRFCAASQIDRQWWNYLILPAATLTAVMAYSVFLNSKAVIQLLFVLDSVFLYFYLRYIYYYLLKPGSYKAFSLENISSYISWLSFFFLSATVYGLQSFLNFPIFQLALVILAAAALISYQVVWANKIEFRKALPYLLISCLVLVELGWSIFFLPFNYNVSGLLLAICFYVTSGLTKNRLLGRLDPAKIKMYLTLGLLSLFLILATARWL